MTTLGATVGEAMALWDQLTANGATRDECAQALERVLRYAWPQMRPWHYLCEACRDTGLEIFECAGDTACGRTSRHGPHPFGRPCWCDAGAKFHPPPQPEPAPPDPRKRRTGFTRAGRR